MSEEDGTGGLIGLLREKGIVRRERTPLGVVLWALFLYVSGASLRRTRDILEHRIRRSHVAIWTWVQRYGSALRGMFHGSSYVERFNETLKDRARPFDKYFPCGLRCNLGHALHWARLVVFHYNWIRPHLSRDNRPPWDRFRGPAWKRFKRAMEAALS